MEKPIRCIVKNENFEVALFDVIAPTNCVLTAPNKFDQIYLYEMSNGLVFKMGIQFSICMVRYEGNFIKRIEHNKNFQFLADQMNFFQNLNKSEIDNLVSTAAKAKEIKALEESIEELRAEKAELEDQIKIYKEIGPKIEELKEFFDKLK